jgi:hypothetical protein
LRYNLYSGVKISTFLTYPAKSLTSRESVKSSSSSVFDLCIIFRTTLSSTILVKGSGGLSVGDHVFTVSLPVSGLSLYLFNSESLICSLTDSSRTAFDPAFLVSPLVLSDLQHWLMNIGVCNKSLTYNRGL